MYPTLHHNVAVRTIVLECKINKNFQSIAISICLQQSFLLILQRNGALFR